MDQVTVVCIPLIICTTAFWIFPHCYVKHKMRCNEIKLCEMPVTQDKEKPEPETYWIPDERCLDVAELWDIHREKNEVYTCINLWRRIHEIIPATVEGDWRITNFGAKIKVEKIN
jgi:hypothetical protein